MSGHNLDVVQEPLMVVTVAPFESVSQNKRRKKKRRRRRSGEQSVDREKTLGRPARMIPDPVCPEETQCSVREVCVEMHVCAYMCVSSLC